MDYKKFLIFVVVLITALSIGMTAYYFLKDDEVIVIKNTSVYANVGDTFNVEIERREKKSQTKVSFYIKDTEIVKRDKNGSFVALSAGQTEIVLVTNKERIETQKCIVNVGAGSVENPYYIDDAEDLRRIGTNEGGFSLDKHYKIIANIDLSGESFTPIGNGVNIGFTGSLDGNGYAISNMSITSTAETKFVNAGLFAKIGQGGLVKDLTLNNATINGVLTYAGVVAGINSGTIECTTINPSSILTQSPNANLGGVAGANEGGKIDRVASYVNLSTALEANANLGGITALNKSAKIVNSYYQGAIASQNASSIAGGIAVTNQADVEKASHIEKCYAVPTFSMGTNKYGVLASNTDSGSTVNNLLGLYYDKDTAGEGVIEKPNGSTVNHLIEGKTKEQMKTKSTYVYFVTPAPETVYNWNFDIIWTLTAQENQVYPTLLMAGNEAEIIPVFDANIIVNASQLQNMDLAGSYKLGNDIDLADLSSWTPIGTEENPFVGFLDGQGFKIKNLNLQSGTNLNGLFGCIGKPATVANFTIEGVNITNGRTVGALAGINNGQVANINVVKTQNLSKINLTVTDDVANVGGLTGINTGTLSNVESNIDIIVNADANQLAEANIGGVIGRNDYVVTNARSSSYITTTLNQAIVGGIVGNNSNFISDSQFKGNIIANTTSDSTYVGGATGYNINGTVTRVGVRATITGYNIGGVVGYMNHGTMTEAYVLQGTTIKGYKVGGLLSSFERGNVENCYTQASLEGSANGSIKAGFSAYVLGYTNWRSEGSYAVMGKCFSAATFDNVGTNYTETYSNIRVSLVGTMAQKEAGVIYDSIYDSTLAGNAKTALGSGNFWGVGSNTGYNYIKHYDNMDGRNSTSNCKSVGTFTDRGFSMQIWTLIDGSYPKLICENSSYFNA